MRVAPCILVRDHRWLLGPSTPHPCTMRGYIPRRDNLNHIFMPPYPERSGHFGYTPLSVVSDSIQICA